MHDFRYPDPLGPPNPSQPCAQLLKGTVNMWYCKNGYPRDPVCEPCQQSVAQDALRPELWRVQLCRNCRLMNNHMPWATVCCQSNTDATVVLTRTQAEMYCCKYCCKHAKRLGQRSVLYGVMDDMGRKDTSAQEKFGEGFERSKLGGKLHRAFMAEIGEEMCQAEVAHHANRAPEYLCSRPEKHVHFYKKALALDLHEEGKGKKRKAAWQEDDEDGYEGWDEGDPGASASAPRARAGRRRLATKPSDLEIYERRVLYWFAPGTPVSDQLPARDTPEEQVAELHAWDFFRFVRFKTGQHPMLEWYEPADRPIVTISPGVKLSIGSDFAFGARWALMQYHSWTDRRHFLDMSDEEVKTYFLSWIRLPSCPWYVVEQYLTENGSRRRGGAGPAGRRSAPAKTDAAEDDAGSANDGADEWDGEKELSVSETEESSDEDAAGWDGEETRVLTLLYKGNVAEVDRHAEQQRKAGPHNVRPDYYRHTRCTNVAQEESSALPAGVISINEDSEDADAYGGEQKEIARELDELRAAQHWVNQEGWDAQGEGRAVSKATGREVDLRLDWSEAQKKLAEGIEKGVDAAPARVDKAVVLRDYALENLDPTQRAFVERVLKWARELVAAYKEVHATGKQRRLPRLRTWLGGSAGSGKSTALKTVVQHVRLLFQEEKVDASIELTAYTGVAAFNIGFGAKTAVSSFQIFPNAAWKAELTGEAARKLERQWENAVLLIVDEISFIGRAFFARMHFRLQQAKRRFFSEAALDPHHYTFGDISIILVGDFGQLEPIHDWSMCDLDARYSDQPKRLLHLWKHARFGKELLQEFDEAFMLTRIHRSQADMWWTQSCLRLRDFEMTKTGDWDEWLSHDLDRGHLSQEQKAYFEECAVWLCARCEDVGCRKGR